MTGLLQDIRYALRQLRKSPGFTAVAVITLALGIGANTAIFSVIDAVLLRSLPYPQPDHIVTVWGNFTGIGLSNDRNAISAPEFKDLQSQNHSFSHVAALTGGASFNVKFGESPERLEGARVSPSFFPLLGVQPALGRVFQSGDEDPGNSLSVVISNGLWQRAFSSDANVIGKTLNVDGVKREIVGVMPPGFEYPENTTMWVPLTFAPGDFSPASRANHGLQLLARIKPELTLSQARADMLRLSRLVEQQNPDYPYARVNFAFVLVPLMDVVVGSVDKVLWILAGTVALILIIACANVANLLLVRASVRTREVAIRTALGAGRGRLVRQWLVESLVISALGGAAGLLVARLSLAGLIHLSKTVFPRVAEAVLDSRVLLFTILTSVVTGVVFGLAPGLQSMMRLRIDALKGNDRNQTATKGTQHLRYALVTGELALSLVLLSAAGLLCKSFLRVMTTDPGIDPKNVLTMRVSLPASKYGDPVRASAFYRDVVERISMLPGVENVGAGNILPLSGGGWFGTTTMDTTAVPPDEASPEADQCVVTPGYFETMGVRLLSGRTFDARDTADAPKVAIVDETLAKTFWPASDAVGKRLHSGGAGPRASWVTIVGVVRHVRSQTLEARSRVQVYWPEDQKPYRSLTLVVKTRVKPESMAASVRHVIHDIDPDQPAYNIRTMDDWRQRSTALRRVGTLLLTAFSITALLLAAIGTYGTIAYSVGQRIPEIGLRLAMGATRSSVAALVFRHGFKVAGIGLGLGLIVAIGAARVLRTVLYEVPPFDVTSFAGAALVLVTVSAVACYIPARRATKVDPMVALRYE